MSEHFPDWSDEAVRPTTPPLTAEDYLGEQLQPWFYSNEPQFVYTPNPIEPMSSAEEELIVAFAAHAEEEIRRSAEQVRVSTSEALQEATRQLLENVVDTVLEEMDAIDAEHDAIIAGHGVSALDETTSRKSASDSPDPDDHPFAIPPTKKTEKRGPGLF